MLAKQALDNQIAPLTADEAVPDAIERMRELGTNVLPVVESTTRKLIGLVHIDQLTNNEGLQSIADVSLQEPVKIYETQHIFEAIRLMLMHELRLLAVVNKELTLQGMICKSEVLETLTNMLNLTEFGSVITIELVQRDFTLSEIVHIVETEGAKILGITVETPEMDQKIFEVSIKLNLKDVSRVAAALRRYEYTVITDSGNEVYEMDIETRADELIKYLDM